MGLQIIEYEGSLDGFSPDRMFGDGFWSEHGWVARVGVCHEDDSIELERRSGYRTQDMSKRGMEAMWKKWKRRLSSLTTACTRPPDLAPEMWT